MTSALIVELRYATYLRLERRADSVEQNANSGVERGLFGAALRVVNAADGD